MIKEFVENWEKNKGVLRKWLSDNHPDDYQEQQIRDYMTLALNAVQPVCCVNKSEKPS